MNSLFKKTLSTVLLSVPFSGILLAQSMYPPVMGRYAEQNAIFITVILAIIFLLLIYRPVLRRKYRSRYAGYVVPALVVVLTIYLILIPIYGYIIGDTPLNLYYKNNFGEGLWAFLGTMAAVSLVFPSLLYITEKFLVQPRMSFWLQWSTKMTVTLGWFYIPMIFANNAAGTGAFKLISLFFIGMAVAVIRGAFLLFNEFSDSLVRKKDVELSQLKTLKAQAEMGYLQARINPHFLYNALNSIAGLARSNPEKTEQMALSLSDLFRYHTNRTSDLFSTVEEELAMVRTYLDIEQIRFGERLQYSITSDPSVNLEKIPRHILQPLVENAVKHGISRIEGQGRITVATQNTAGHIILEVNDNGPGFPEGLMSGYGLQSIHDMLQLMYGDKASILWENQPLKRIRVNIPLDGNALRFSSSKNTQ